jgi:hypothetical protein
MTISFSIKEILSQASQFVTKKKNLPVHTKFANVLKLSTKKTKVACAPTDKKDM